MHLAADVQYGAFRGRNDSAWIDASAWDRFRSELRSLERAWRGAAHLASVSPAGLELRIAVIDHAGDLVVEGHVGDDMLVMGESHEVRLAHEIESFVPAG